MKKYKAHLFLVNFQTEFVCIVLYACTYVTLDKYTLKIEYKKLPSHRRN